MSKEYVERVINWVKERNPGEVEFHQTVEEVLTSDGLLCKLKSYKNLTLPSFANALLIFQGFCYTDSVRNKEGRHCHG